MRSLRHFAELTWLFASKEIAIRYKQSVLGIVWVLLQPLLLVLLFSIIFRNAVSNMMISVPYVIFVFSGLMFWNHFSSTLQRGQTCLLRNAGLLKKIYFPRISVILADVISFTIDFVIIFVLFIVLVLITHTHVSIKGMFLLVLPFGVQLTMLFGMVTIAAVLLVYFRDIQYIISFLLRAMMFITPVIYPSRFIPEKYRFIMDWNPVTVLLNTYRDLIFTGSTQNWDIVGMIFMGSLVLLIAGIILLRTTDRLLGDIA